MASPGCRRWQHKGLTSTNPALNRYGRSRSALYRADMAMGNPAQWPFHAPRAHPASTSPHSPFAGRAKCYTYTAAKIGGVERVDQMLIGMLCRICRCFTRGPREREHAAKPEEKASGEPPPESAGKPQAGGKNRQGAGPPAWTSVTSRRRRRRAGRARRSTRCWYSSLMSGPVPPPS